jgi:hypothetical protein
MTRLASVKRSSQSLMTSRLGCELVATDLDETLVADAEVVRHLV